MYGDLQPTTKHFILGAIFFHVQTSFGRQLWCEGALMKTTDTRSEEHTKKMEDYVRMYLQALYGMLEKQ